MLKVKGKEMKQSPLWMRSLNVVIYKRLIRPMIHSTQPPVYKARGVAVGMAWAMTPLVGVQMGLVAMTWGVSKAFKWSFSLPLALAWTWVTNVITLPPIYYLFYVTGQLMRGQFQDISGYQSLQILIKDVFLSNEPFVQQVADFLKLFVQDWGISMFVGCVPWIIIGSIAGYQLTMRFEKRRLERKLEREKKNEASVRIKRVN